MNICHYGPGFEQPAEPEASASSLLAMCRDENEKIEIFTQASERTITLLESCVRNESCRGMLKRALNIYCECITQYVESIRPAESRSSPLLTDLVSDAPEDKWSQCLYQIVIAIVRILRLDFENQDNTVEIELVIYFYEILAVCDFYLYFYP